MSKNVMLRKTATISVSTLLLLGLFCIASFAKAATAESYSGRGVVVMVTAQLPLTGARAPSLG
jgi:hypothetical protein